MRRLLHPKMTWQFVLFLGVIGVLPLLFFALISYSTSRRVIQADVTRFMQTLVVDQKDYLEQIMAEVESLITNISGVEEIREAIDDTNQYRADYTYQRLATHARIGYILSSYLSLHGLVSIDIFTPGGAHYHVGDTLNVRDIDDVVLKQIWANVEKGSTPVVWTGMERNVNINSAYEQVVTAAKLLRAVDAATLQERPGALMLVNYSPESLYDHYRQLDLGAGGYLLIIDPQNRIVFHPDKANIGHKVMPAFIERLTGPQGAFIMALEQQKMLVTYCQSKVSGWYLAGLVPMHTVTASADTIRDTGIAMLLVSIGFVAVIGVGFSRTMVRPLTYLTGLFKNIQNNTFDWQFRLMTFRSDEIGELFRWFNAFLDSMAIQRQTEQALLQAKDAAEAANRAKSVFLASISHELRTPLTAILGFAEVMLHDELLADRQRENVEIIHRSGEHLLALINDVLDLSKIEAGRTELRPAAFDLHEMLLCLGEMFSLRARQKGLTVVFDLAPSVPQYICTDMSKLRQVLINLLGNAVKFTEQGSITLRVTSRQGNKGSVDKEGQIPVPLLTPSLSILSFEIQDTGVGIASDELEKLFDAFMQTESGRQSGQGTGLGLPISRQYVRLMGGDLTVQSKVGQGSVFAFDIQAEFVDAAKVEDTYAARQIIGLEPRQPVYRILVVEDDAASRTLLVKLLSPLGFELCEAANGQEAIAIWESWRPQLIFMDMRMPKMDGREAIKEIKARIQNQALKSETIFVALTASAFEEERENIIAGGCDDFVRKPFQKTTIFDILMRHLRVRFVYAAPNVEQVSAEARPDHEPDADAIQTRIHNLDPAWVSAMRQAVIVGDMQQMLALLEQLSQAGSDPGLVDKLTQLVYGFEHDEILAWLHSGGSE
ncbi:MAG: response regulator [Anaerolineae bacterium]|nr:response regulator [Anaerolineae bacterium]